MNTKKTIEAEVSNSDISGTYYSGELPGTVYEEFYSKRVREIHGTLANDLRNRFGVLDETPVILHEMHFFASKLDPSKDDGFSLAITCGEHSTNVMGATPELNFQELVNWAKGN